MAMLRLGVGQGETCHANPDDLELGSHSAPSVNGAGVRGQWSAVSNEIVTVCAPGPTCMQPGPGAGCGEVKPGAVVSMVLKSLRP